MRSTLLTLALFGLACGTSAGQSPAAPAVWELSPYRIRVLVAAATDAELSPNTAADLATQVAARAAAVVGAWWQVSAKEAEADLAAAMLMDLAGVDAKALGELKDTDKVILLTLARAADGNLSLQAREYDVLTGLWNAPVKAPVQQPAGLAQAGLRTVLLAFAPLARIDSVTGDTATLTLRGGALPLRDRELDRVQSGAAFRPVLVTSDTGGKLAAGAAQVVELTYLLPLSASSSAVRCRVLTGLTGTLPEYHPLRQRLAIGVSPSSRSTELTLVSRGDEAAPLEGYDVLLREPPAADGSVALKLLGRSDRRGKVSLAPTGQAVQTLVVRYGQTPLVELPLAVGLAAEMALPLPDVRGSAALEAALAELEDRALDVLARKAALEARRKAAAGDSAALTAVDQQLAKLPKLDGLLAALAQHEKAVQSTQPQVRSRLETKAAALRQLLSPPAAAAPAP